MNRAIENYNKLRESLDFRLLHFRTYGADWIKANANLSPDSYVQMALQLAYYRLHGTGNSPATVNSFLLSLCVV